MSRTQRLVISAMLGALAFLAMLVIKVPVIMFLNYEPKDVIITIGGFLFGPLTAFCVIVVVSFVEMITVSTTGPIGLVMNIIASASFACTASFIYKHKHSLSGAVAGLAAGGLLTVVVMLLWNYLIVPIYMGMPREAIAAMLIPVFLPFNLLKCSLNAALIMLLYKPVSRALRLSRLPIGNQSDTPVDAQKRWLNPGVILVSCFIIGTCVFLILVLQKKI